MFHENWCSQSQIEHIKNLLNNVEHLNGLYIELGCWTGFSSVHIMNHIHPKTLHIIDTFEGNKDEAKVEGKEHITQTILKERDIYNEFLNNVNSLTRGNYILHKTDHYEYLRNLNEPIAFIYIDGSHDYYSVYNQLKLVLPLMCKNGLIICDDFWSSNIKSLDYGVNRAVNELLPNFRSIDNMAYYIHYSNHNIKTNGELYYSSSDDSSEL